MFAWDIYDASVFLIEMNQGYAMTIPDSEFLTYEDVPGTDKEYSRREFYGI